MFESDELKYVTMSLKPNLKLLGPKLGGALRDVQKAIQKLTKTAKRLTQNRS